ncbi:ATP-binding protein [Humidesulfovibrio sp.]
MQRQQHLGTPLLFQWVILITAVLVTGLGLGLDLHQKRERLQADEQQRLLGQARVVEHILSRNLASLDQVLEALALEWDGRSASRELNSRLQTLEGGMPGVRSIFLLDAGGTILAANREELLGKNFAHRPYFQVPQQGGDAKTLYVSPPFRSSLGTFTINFSRSAHAADGRFLGVVTAALDPAYFSPLLDSVLYTPDMWASLTHSDGILYLRHPWREGYEGRDLTRSDTPFSMHRRSGRSVSFFPRSTVANGETRLLALRDIKPAALRMDRYLVVAISRDPKAVLAPWYEDLILYLGVYLLLTLGAAAAVLLYQRKQRELDRRDRLAAQALLESHQFIRAITENIPGMVGYWTSELRCAFANTAYLEWFGKTREQAPGLHMRELLGPELFARNEPHILGALRGESQRFERQLVRADGRTLYAQIHYIPDLDGQHVKGFFVLLSDISELKNAQILLEQRVEERTTELRATVQALEAAKRRAEAASEAKSAFLANLSHELRTPLNPIVALSGLMLDAQLPPEQQRDYLQEVHAASQRLLTLFNRLFDLLALEGRENAPISMNLALFLEAVLHELSAPAKAKGLALRLEISPGLPLHVLVDAGLLKLVLQELGENAVRFTPAGQVLLRAAPRGGQGEPLQMVVSVEDTGLGIPPERIEAIRSGLTQSDAPLTKRFAGLGIGMARVAKAISLLGGSLEIDSEPGRGTAMRVVLPLGEALQSLEGLEYVCDGQGACSWRPIE